MSDELPAAVLELLGQLEAAGRGGLPMVASNWDPAIWTLQHGLSERIFPLAGRDKNGNVTPGQPYVRLTTKGAAALAELRMAGRPAGKKAKRSTSPGAAREKIIAGLSEHHQYDGQSVLNTDPIKVGRFAKSIGVSKGSVSEFLKAEFRGYAGYVRWYCSNPGVLVKALQLLRAEVSPKILSRPLDSGREDG